MYHLRRLVPFSFAAAAFLTVSIALLAFAAPASADDDMQWSFSEANEPENKGRLTARLSYGVPETDNIQVTGVCDGSPSTSVKFASLTFGADLGKDMKPNDPVDLRFSGGGFERTVKGTVHLPQAEEGIAGVHLDLEHDDPLWQAFLEKQQLDYSVPGYRASSINLTRGRDNLKAFNEACKAYAAAILGSGSDDKSVGDTQQAAASSPEKDAFDSAKELGTIEGWNAFLGNYSSGFYADLARAYVKKLQAGADAGPGAGNAPPQQPDPQALGPTMAPISKIPPIKEFATLPYPAKRSCSSRDGLRSHSSTTPARIGFAHFSGPQRDVYWIDYQGRAHNYITIKAGQATQVDTFLTHPWMITDAKGNCIEIVLPRPVVSVVRFGSPPQPKTTSAKPTKCRRGYVKVDGRCIRKRDAATSCGPGYRLQGNKCVQGYQPPPPQAQRPSWQIEGIKHGCKPGLAWNAQEGCHEND